uniref:Uncharacterized protein n=1 Tax=Arundo donax TaxID=35708 RepID=A0A0A9HQ65_ARUDO
MPPLPLSASRSEFLAVLSPCTRSRYLRVPKWLRT